MSTRSPRRPAPPRRRNPVSYALATGRNGDGTHEDTRRRLLADAEAEDERRELEEEAE